MPTLSNGIHSTETDNDALRGRVDAIFPSRDTLALLNLTLKVEIEVLDVLLDRIGLFSLSALSIALAERSFNSSTLTWTNSYTQKPPTKLDQNSDSDIVNLLHLQASDFAASGHHGQGD